MSEDSQFMRVVSIRRSFWKVKALTRRTKALAEMKRLLIERQASRMHMNRGGTHTGLVAKGEVPKKKPKKKK